MEMYGAYIPSINTESIYEQTVNSDDADYLYPEVVRTMYRMRRQKLKQNTHINLDVLVQIAREEMFRVEPDLRTYRY